MEKPDLSWSAPIRPVGDELATLLSEFERTVSSHVPATVSDEHFTGANDPVGRALHSGSWLDLGLPGAAGAESLGLAELAEFARIWGRYLVPLPFLQTVLWNRWTDGAVADGRFLTFALDAGAKSLAPHGTAADIVIEPNEPSVHPGAVDGFAPSLPLVEVPIATDLTASAFIEAITLLAAEAIGAAEMAMAQGLAYTHQREAYGRTINRFQALRHWSADMQRDIELAKSCVFYLSTLTDRSEAASAARSSVSRAQSVASRTIQLFGGIGFTWELGIHFYVRHTMAIQRLLCS